MRSEGNATLGAASGWSVWSGTPSPPETGYADPIDIDGIPLRDQVWFSLEW
jgi:hypothetical protein